MPITDVMLPSELERQQIFNWLQILSSVTAWRRILEFYKAWATAVENSLREASERGWEAKTALPESEYVLILKALAHCEEGVIRLSKGDKRVFNFDANGEFAMAFRILSHWRKMITRIDEGENGIDADHTPHWQTFKERFVQAHSAWEECSTEILEPRYLGEPGLTLYGDWLIAELKKISFPPQLEATPDPVQNTFARTGEYTPCSGIWEPIMLDQKRSLIGIFSNIAPPAPPFTVMGAMNYLHGGKKTPQITVETATDNLDLDTTWRLIWRDDRYTDGLIPDRESFYRFTQPE